MRNVAVSVQKGFNSENGENGTFSSMKRTRIATDTKNHSARMAHTHRPPATHRLCMTDAPLKTSVVTIKDTWFQRQTHFVKRAAEASNRTKYFMEKLEIERAEMAIDVYMIDMQNVLGSKMEKVFDAANAFLLDMSLIYTQVDQEQEVQIKKFIRSVFEQKMIKVENLLSTRKVATTLYNKMQEDTEEGYVHRGDYADASRNMHLFLQGELDTALCEFKKEVSEAKSFFDLPAAKFRSKYANAFVYFEKGAAGAAVNSDDASDEEEPRSTNKRPCV